MQNRTVTISTKDVERCIEQALNNYQLACTGFFKKPGEEGKLRERALQELKKTIADKNASEAFAMLYSFYIKEKQHVRLVGALRYSLLELMNIPLPQYKNNLSDYNEQWDATLNNLHDEGTRILIETGLMQENNQATMMQSFGGKK